MFDSGFGGLTVARAVFDLLPAEDLVYIGDTGRYPYGPRPQGEVRVFARELAWSLVKDFDAKAVVERSAGFPYPAPVEHRRSNRRTCMPDMYEDVLDFAAIWWCTLLKQNPIDDRGPRKIIQLSAIGGRVCSLISNKCARNCSFRRSAWGLRS